MTIVIMDELLSLLDAQYHLFETAFTEQECYLISTDDPSPILQYRQRFRQYLVKIIDLVRSDPDHWTRYPLYHPEEDYSVLPLQEHYKRKLRVFDPLDTYLPKEREIMAADIARFLLQPGVTDTLLA